MSIPKPGGIARDPENAAAANPRRSENPSRHLGAPAHKVHR